MNDNIYLKTINNYKFLFIKTNDKLSSIQSYIFTGPYNENIDNIGINHLLEHVLINSYNKCNSNCFKYLNKLGITYNATTYNNLINYYVEGMSDKIDLMINYIINITLNPNFDKKIIDKEKEAVYNELIENYDEPTTKLYNILNKNIYTNIGFKHYDDIKLQLKILKNLNKNKLYDYFNKYYNLNKILFVISGDYNSNKINKELHKITYKYKIDDISKSSIISYKPCLNYTNKIFYIKDTSLMSSKLLYYFPADIIPNSNESIIGKFTLRVLSNILFEELRTKYDLIYGLSIKLKTNICGSVIEILISTKNDNINKVNKLLKQYIELYRNKLISNEYINSEKERKKIKYMKKKMHPTNLSNFYGSKYLYNILFGFKIINYDEVLDIILKIKKIDIKKFINKYLNLNNCLLAYTNNNDKLMIN